MKGFAVIIVGYQGAGKSLLTKALLEKIHREKRRILDVNNEYNEYTDITYLDDEGLLDIDAFAEDMIAEKEKFFVCEDATVVFSHRKYDSRLPRAIVGKRHNKNVYVFLFHSLRVVPRDIFEYSDELWLLKTADTDDTLDSKYKGTGVQELLNRVRQLPEFEWTEKQPLPVRGKHFEVMQIKKGKIDRTVKRTESET